MLKWPGKRPRLRALIAAAAIPVSSSLLSLGPAGAVPAAASTSVFCPNAGTVCVSYASEWFEPFPGGFAAVHIFGRVHNETSDDASLIRVTLSVPSGSGSLTETAWSSIDVLGPGQFAPFEAVMAPAPNTSPGAFTITAVSFARATASPYSHLSIPSFGSCTWAPSNPNVICGTVLNAGTGAVNVGDVHVVMTFFHQDNTNTEVMVAQDRINIDPIVNTDPTLNDMLRPGDSGTFSIDRTGDPVYDSVTTVAEPAYPLDFSRDTLPFGNQLVGTTSAPQSIRITNNGTLPVAIAIAIAPDFTQTNDCGTSLGAGSSCNVTVQFVPNTIGDEVGTFLTVTSDEAGSPDTVRLTGTGVAPRVKFDTPGGTSFGIVSVGQSSAPLSVVLSNTGNATLVYTIGLSSDLSLVLPNPCNGTLPQQQSCTMHLVWAPNAPFFSHPTLTLTDNAPDHQQQLGFTGYGVGPALTFDPASLDFGDTLIPASQKTVQLINSGNADLIINSVSTIGPFGATPCTTMPFTVAPGQSCWVVVSVLPSSLGAATGYLVVADNAGGHLLLITGGRFGGRTPAQSPPHPRGEPPPPVGH